MIATFKENNDILDIAERYCELQKVGSSYRAKENPIREERTSSLYFYPDTQKYYDFGSSEGGDVIDFLGLMGVDFRTMETSTTPARAPVRKKEEITPFLLSADQLLHEFNSFDRDIPKEELLATVPKYLINEADQADLDLFFSVTRYDRINKTLVMGWYENQGLDFTMVSYKRRRFNGGKWVNRKDTHPNKTAFTRIYDDTKPVYILEGARDALTAVLMGLNFIAIPTTSYSGDLPLTGDQEAFFFAEDLQGYKSMKQLSEPYPNSKIIHFVRTDKEKMDLSDVANKCGSLKGVLNAINSRTNPDYRISGV